MTHDLPVTRTAKSKTPARTLRQAILLCKFTIPVEFGSCAVTNVGVSKTQTTETQTWDIENKQRKWVKALLKQLVTF